MEQQEPMALIQFTRFGIAESKVPSMLDTWRASLDSSRVAYPALREALLIKLEGGNWLDITVWESPTSSIGRSEIPPVDARAHFFEQIDELFGEESGHLAVYDGAHLGVPNCLGEGRPFSPISQQWRFPWKQT